MTDDERLGPPPIDPLSDAAWSRVERGLWARMDATGATGATIDAPRTAGRAPVVARHRWIAVTVTVAAAAATVAIVVGARRPAPEVAVADEPARVVTGAAPSSVSFGDVHIELDADTALAMTHETGAPIAALERGAAWFTVAPRGSRPRFVVRAGDTTVRVVGTRFRVARSGERSLVDVEHGLVEVEFRGHAVGVAANQRWSSAAPGQISTTGGQPPDEAAAPVEAAGQSPDAAAAPAPPPLVAPATSRPAHAAHGPPPGPRPGPEPAAAIPTRPEPALGSAHPANPADSDRERAEYERLAALEPTSPDAALAGYLALARRTTPWADPALFAAARLAVDRGDHRAQALLAIYLQRFPGGANAADATQLLARLKSDQP